MFWALATTPACHSTTPAMAVAAAAAGT